MLTLTKRRQSRATRGLAGLRRYHRPVMTRDQRIRSLREAGMSFVEIADMVGVTKGVVAGVLFRSGKGQSNVCD